jgi:DUF438 domain-containing protein
MSELIDNREQRVRTLKGIIKRLHAGAAPDEVRASLKELVCQTDYSEVMAMEQELIADGMPVEEIQGMCDLHSQVTREVLVQLAPSRRHVSPGERGPAPVHRAPATGDESGPSRLFGNVGVFRA